MTGNDCKWLNMYDFMKKIENRGHRRLCRKNDFLPFSKGVSRGGSRVTLGKMNWNWGMEIDEKVHTSNSEWFLNFQHHSEISYYNLNASYEKNSVEISITNLIVMLGTWKPLRIARINFLVNFHTSVSIHFFQSYSATPLSRPPLWERQKIIFSA